MKIVIRKLGNSHAVIIPKPLLAEIGAKAGDRVDMTVQGGKIRSEEHTSELQSQSNLVCRLLLEKKTVRMFDIIKNALPHIAPHNHRYLLCVGTWESLPASISSSVSNIDCLTPTRYARPESQIAP